MIKSRSLATFAPLAFITIVMIMTMAARLEQRDGATTGVKLEDKSSPVSHGTFLVTSIRTNQKFQPVYKFYIVIHEEHMAIFSGHQSSW